MNDHGAVAAFLMAFPALFSIVNPVAGAFIFREATADRTHAERVSLAKRVGLYSLLVMLVALGAGSYVLTVFGISIAALRIAGGLVLALFAWELLNAPDKRDVRKQEQSAGASDGPADDVAFFPLTLPFTTGPGTIAVAVALGSGHPATGAGQFFAGVAAAALALAVVIAALYAYSDALTALLGRNGSRTVTRLSAFLLFCIGVQLLINGVVDVLEPLLTR
jgi:multiple antibiotic resistance protein